MLIMCQPTSGHMTSKALALATCDLKSDIKSWSRMSGPGGNSLKNSSPSVSIKHGNAICIHASALDIYLKLEEFIAFSRNLNWYNNCIRSECRPLVVGEKIVVAVVSDCTWPPQAAG